MCEPISAITVPQWFQMGATAMGAVGAIAQGNQAAAQHRYNAQVAQNNALIEQWRLEDALERGQEEEMTHRMRLSKQLGNMRAVAAASGFQVDQGSNLDVYTDTVLFGEMDALNIRNNAIREAYGHDLNAYNYTNTAGAERVSAKNARRSGRLKAGATVLGGLHASGLGKGKTPFGATTSRTSVKVSPYSSIPGTSTIMNTYSPSYRNYSNIV